MAGIQLTTTKGELNEKLGDPGEGKFWFPSDLSRDKSIPVASLALLLNLMSYEDNSNRSIGEIAKEIGASSNTVRKHLKVLEERGYLTYTPIVHQAVPGKRRKMSVEKSLAVFDRDGYRCLHCGTRKRLTVDHIRPIDCGGSDDMSNLQTLCHSCNSRKGAKWDGDDK